MCSKVAIHLNNIRSYTTPFLTHARGYKPLQDTSGSGLNP